LSDPGATVIFVEDEPGMSTVVTRAYRFALDPTPSQVRDLERYAGAARFAFNWALAAVRANRPARRTALLGAVHPVPQRLGVHTQLAGDLGDRPTPRTDLAFELTHHRHGTFLHFNRVLAHCCHADHPSQDSWPPTNPG
jgi:hypothetical protein